VQSAWYRRGPSGEARVSEAYGPCGIITGVRGGGDPTLAPALLNDASLFLQAQERGWMVLTRNFRNFDYLDQLLPAGRVLFYRQA